MATLLVTTDKWDAWFTKINDLITEYNATDYSDMKVPFQVNGDETTPLDNTEYGEIRFLADYNDTDYANIRGKTGTVASQQMALVFSTTSGGFATTLEMTPVGGLTFGVSDSNSLFNLSKGLTTLGATSNNNFIWNAGVSDLDGDNNYSFGNDVSITGDFNSVLGGTDCTITGDYSFVGGGNTNVISTHYSAIVGGNNNTISSGNYSTIAAGSNNSISSTNAFIGGGTYNSVEAEGAAIVSGVSTDAGVTYNRAVGKYSFIGSGIGNVAGDVANINHSTWGVYSFVGAGTNNTAEGIRSFVGSGNGNTAESQDSFIGGGVTNAITGIGSIHSCIVTGNSNTISQPYSFIGSGSTNNVSAPSSVIVGGNTNIISQSYSFIGGGVSNTISAIYGTIVGGQSNTVSGDYSFANGKRAKAEENGQFVISDSQNFDFSDTVDTTSTWAADQFHSRYTGGYQLVSGVDGAGIPDFGVTLAADANAWGTVSDKNRKDNFKDIDHTKTVDKFRKANIQEWQYKADIAKENDRSNYGWTAQDFHKAFNFGKDVDKLKIDTLQYDGVLSSAIKGLIEIVDKQQKEIESLKKKLK